MSGSKTNRFFSSLANKFLGPDIDRGQPYSPYGAQYGAPQYGLSPAFSPEQFLSGQTTQYTGSVANDQARQHNGHVLHGDNHGTHVNDSAHMNSGTVHYANTYNYYQSEYFAAAREQQTNSAPPGAGTAPPAHSRTPPNLPPRAEGAASEPPPQAITRDWSKVIHLARCDNCGSSPLRGIRWKCNTCRDHDVCDECKNNGGDEGHSFRSLPSQGNFPLQLASLSQAAAAGSRYGVMSQLVPGCMIEMCEQPRLDPLVAAARNGHFQVCQELMEKLGLVYPSQCISVAIQSAKTAPGYMGNLLATYLESQATLIEQQKQRSATTFGGF